MRIASLIISWLVWPIAALYWIYLTAVSFHPRLLPPGSAKPPTDNLSLYTALTTIGLGYAFWFVRKKIWFDPRRKVGVGFFLYLFPLYLFVFSSIVGPYLEYILHGIQSPLFKYGFLSTLPLLVLCFPRLPKAQ